MAERFIPRAQEIYRHFKGDLYQVLAVAEHTETGEELVIYQAMYGEFKIYARPLEMFVSPVDRTKYPDADQELRFQLQGPGAGRQREAAAAKGTVSGMQIRLEKEAAVEGHEMQKVFETVFDTHSAKQDSAPPSEPEEPGLDPLVLEFLDARTYEQRLNVLAALHHRITNEMITTMALCCDIEVEGEDVEQRYEELKQCLITKDRFEIKRLG
ncbi:MAG: DUF1653 domain-containing protein [Acetatifactor sp.]|nr:DUF1653 domain-containing protein [Acetatifactor sp.]